MTCRVLGFSKQAFYKWNAQPSRRDWDDAHLINAPVDIHHDDPEFGYRFITDELADRGAGRQPRPGEQALHAAPPVVGALPQARPAPKPGPPVHDSKYHRGKQVWVRGSTVKVSGQNQPYVRDMRSEVKIVSRLLSSAVGEPVHARGVVAIICDDFKRKGEDDCDVKVIGRKALDAWLKRQPTERLTPAQVAGIFEQARRSTCWLPAEK